MSDNNQLVNEEEIKKQNSEELNDPSDKLTPEHPRFKEVLKRAKEAEEKATVMEQKLQELEAKINKRQTETGEMDLTADERIAYEKIKVLNKEAGFLTKEEWESNKRVEQKTAEISRLRGVYNGEGKVHDLPKFDPIETEIYAKENGISNLEVAFREMHREAFIQHEIKLRQTPEIEVPQSEKPGGGGERQIGNTKLTGNDISKMTDEEYEENRIKILGSMKPVNR